MDDDQVHSFQNKGYEKSNDLEEISPLQRFLTILKVLPNLLMKGLLVILLEVYFALRAPFYYFVPPPLNEIRGQLAVVTGGSNGIGREICLELARNGCNIACLDVDLEGAKKMCDELKSFGVKANPYKVDITNYERIEEVKKKINAEMGIVDILVNNAGLMPRNSFRDGDYRAVQRVMDVNVMSHFWTTRIFIGDMIDRHYGHIVAISSMIAFYPMSTTVSYTTSKYAVKGFMDALNRESIHENWGVKTLTVFPHLTNTRKEVIDFMRKKVSPTTLERIRFRSPVEVGKETVYALRRGVGYVAVPRYCLPIGKLVQSLSFEVQDIADELFMPRVTSKTDHTATEKASLSSNAGKKSQ